MFTPYERRQLRLIEEWFEQDDPQLAQTLRSGPTRKPSTAPQIIAVCVAIGLGILGVMTGAYLLIFGAMIAGVVSGCLVATRHNKQS
jgi:hypothetical protein